MIDETLDRPLICSGCDGRFIKGVDIQQYNSVATYGKCENCRPAFDLAENEVPNIYE